MFSWMKRVGNSSSCIAWKSKAAELVPLAAGLVLTGAAIFLARHRIAAAEREIVAKAAPVDIVVAAAPITTATAFSRENLAKKSVPSSGTGRRNVPAKEFELLLGAKAKTDIAPGEPVLWTDVDEPFDVDRFSQLIPEGQRAITLEADVTASFAGLIRPGDRVDVFCEKDGSASPRAGLRNVAVLAVDRNFNRPGAVDGDAGTATITLLVSPEDGARLSTFSRTGKLRWLLRNPDDNTLPAAPTHVSGAPPPQLVEVWQGGIRVVPHGTAAGGAE